MRSTAVAAREKATAVETAARRFRIAVLSYGLPCPGEKRSGIEQVAHDLANALVGRGHAVTVFTYDPRPADGRYETAALPWRSFATSRYGRALTMGYFGNVVALGPRYEEFDIIVAHGDALLLPFKGKPVVRVMHGSALQEAVSARSLARVVLQAGVYVQELATALFLQGTVAVSANTRRFNPFVRHVISNGVDLNRFHPDPRTRTAHPSILFVGALNGRKRGAWLIDRFEQEIRPGFPDAELHMVTKPGPARAGVTYHTGIAPEALVRLYQRAWIYATPSTYEGFGLPYVEALACGTPIVTTSNPGALEVLDGGRFGRVVADDEFASEAIRLLANAGERQRLGALGLLRAADFDVVKTAAAYETLMEKLVPCHGR